LASPWLKRKQTLRTQEKIGNAQLAQIKSSLTKSQLLGSANTEETDADNMAFQLIKAEAQDDSAQRWSQFAHKFVDAATRGDAFCLETAADVVAMVGEMGRLRRELAQAREQEKKALESQGDMETKVEGLKKALQVSP
jgi:hypothetical protein